MRTVQITLDEDLIDAVDSVAKELRTTRSAFTRSALQRAITRIRMEKLEERHRQGYLKQPVSEGEFNVWEEEQKLVDFGCEEGFNF
ncbi:MAG: ribbon-helix-helix domain-containing protein [Thermodesulfobacteriota bacterium]